jgi:hypothetical protein
MDINPPDRACHELLVALAGRLPDELLWRLRDWLASGGRTALAAVVPRELMRHRVALTDEERSLMAASVGAWGAAPRLLDAVLPAYVLPAPPAFGPDPDDTDVTALTALAVVRGDPGCTELRLARRADGRRVVLVQGAERPWALTGVLQRVLRARGDRSPNVEVLPADLEVPAYHGAVIAATLPVWIREPIGIAS